MKTKDKFRALAVAIGSASPARAADQIVVYRSQYERDMDAFWYEHPEIILWVIGLLLAAIVVGFAINFFMERRRRW